MLLLSEKSSNDLESGEIITAHPEFFFLSTMNPGGDYGKKEVRILFIYCYFYFFCHKYSLFVTKDLILSVDFLFVFCNSIFKKVAVFLFALCRF